MTENVPLDSINTVQINTGQGDKSTEAWKVRHTERPDVAEA